MKIEKMIVLLMLVGMPAFGQAQANDEQKALESFKALVHLHVESYKPTGREHVTKLGDGWVKERFTLDPTSAKFDVERTSSLMSPFVGTLNFTLTRDLTDSHSTEAEAAADSVFARRTSSIHKHAFAYQDHQWQPTSRRHGYLDGPLVGSDFPCDGFLLTKEKPAEKDINGCLEEFDKRR